MAITLLLVKYCLLGRATTIVSPSSEIFTRGVVGSVEPKFSGVATLDLL
jgi:hypothetical protein